MAGNKYPNILYHTLYVFAAEKYLPYEIGLFFLFILYGSLLFFRGRVRPALEYPLPLLPQGASRTPGNPGAPDVSPWIPHGIIGADIVPGPGVAEAGDRRRAVVD